ncbi:MAG: hypothetical protein M3Y41_18190, partial [Pseudomonadota bacterium]|nr:hypothetical protein [Pseudomonadota bacterium]
LSVAHHHPNVSRAGSSLFAKPTPSVGFSFFIYRPTAMRGALRRGMGLDVAKSSDAHRELADKGLADR